MHEQISQNANERQVVVNKIDDDEVTIKQETYEDAEYEFFGRNTCLRDKIHDLDTQIKWDQNPAEYNDKQETEEDNSGLIKNEIIEEKHQTENNTESIHQIPLNCDVKPEIFTEGFDYSSHVLCEIAAVDEIDIKPESYDDSEIDLNKQSMEVNSTLSAEASLDEQPPKQQFKCPFCSCKFNEHLDYNDHVKKCATDDDVDDELESEYPNEDLNSKFGYRCYQGCRKVYKSSWLLKRHVKIWHPSAADVKHFVCSFCDKRLSNDRDLKDHVTKLHTTKRFQCVQCDAHFPSKSYLAIHMRVHTNERPFKCKVCPKEFKYAGNLRAHNIKKHPLTT